MKPMYLYVSQLPFNGLYTLPGAQGEPQGEDQRKGGRSA